jgi:hypothetical protein
MQRVAVSALAVLALHVLFGLGIALSPPYRAMPGTRKPLVLLTDLSPAVTRPSVADITVDINLSVPLPRRSLPVVPVAHDDDGVIVDAAPADAIQVARICRAWSDPRGRRGDAQQTLSVLVRVAEDGRVLDSRLESGTGSADRDAALLHCLLTLAKLTPFRSEGHAVTAWQRLNPLGATAEAAARRP